MRFVTLVLACVGHVPGQDFRVIAGDDQVSGASVAAVDRLTRRAFAEVAPNFPRTQFRPFTVHLHASGSSLGPELRHALHPGTAGCALLGRDEIHLMLREAINDPGGGLAGVVKHELVHVLLEGLLSTAAYLNHQTRLAT